MSELSRIAGPIFLAILALIPTVLCAVAAYKQWNTDRPMALFLVAMSSGSFMISSYYGIVSYTYVTDGSTSVFAPMTRLIFTFIIITTTGIGYAFIHKANVRNGNAQKDE